MRHLGHVALRRSRVFENPRYRSSARAGCSRVVLSAGRSTLVGHRQRVPVDLEVGPQPQPPRVRDARARHRPQVDQDRLVLAGRESQVRRDDDPAARPSCASSDSPRGCDRAALADRDVDAAVGRIDPAVARRATGADRAESRAPSSTSTKWSARDALILAARERREIAAVLAARRARSRRGPARPTRARPAAASSSRARPAPAARCANRSSTNTSVSAG